MSIFFVITQGGVVSPTLANLFLHYAFDMWMVVEMNDLWAVAWSILLTWVLLVLLLAVAPAKAVNRRLIFLALGLLLLIALNELSKFGLDVTAPKLQG